MTPPVYFIVHPPSSAAGHPMPFPSHIRACIALASPLAALACGATSSSDQRGAISTDDVQGPHVQEHEAITDVYLPLK